MKDRDKAVAGGLILLLLLGGGAAAYVLTRPKPEEKSDLKVYYTGGAAVGHLCRPCHGFDETQP